MQEENSFKAFVQMIYDYNNKCVDDLTRELQEVKRSLEFTQSEVDDKLL